MAAAITPGMTGAVVLILSLLAKLFMTFGFRASNDTSSPKFFNASKAQLNVAEYEAVFAVVLLFFHSHQPSNDKLVMATCVIIVLSQLVYFWGRALTGEMMPWAPLGALPRYIGFGIMIYLLYTVVDTTTFGPGLSAVAVLTISLIAKLTMSFGFRAQNDQVSESYMNASKAQLNIAEYDGIFVASLLLLFYDAGVENIFVTIVCWTLPLAQAIYFFGRVLSGKMMPWAPLGALPRYISMGLMIYIIYTILQDAGAVNLGPGACALAILFLSLAAKLYMSFCIRAKQSDYEALGQGLETSVDNASKAQLNVAEYEGVFMAAFLFLYRQKTDNLLVTIVCIGLPLCQGFYFWGRALSGQMTPWAFFALPRYICYGILCYIVVTEVQ